MRLKGCLLTLAVIGMVILHQDWWWKDAKPLLFGFLPAGLWYHAAYSIAAAILLAIMVRYAWPKHLENVPTQEPDQDHPAGKGH